MNETHYYDCEYIQRLVKEQFNIKSLFPIQYFIIYNLLCKNNQLDDLAFEYTDTKHSIPEDIDDSFYYKKHQIVILPTGMGKTICFQIPAMLSKKTTLIIYPLLSLIHDQYKRFYTSMPCDILVGGMSKTHVQDIFKKVEQGNIHCLLSNPETILAYRTQLQKIHFDNIILDEAHCVSKWGLSFRPSYAKIGSLLSELNYNHIAAFTATASQVIIKDIIRLAFQGKRPYIVQEDANRKNISYSMLHCLHKEQALLSLLCKNNYMQNTIQHIGTNTIKPNNIKNILPKLNAPLVISQVEKKQEQEKLSCQNDFSCVERPAIVFCNKRKKCRRLALLLHDNLHDTEIYFYHAGLSKEERKNIEQWFFKSTNGVLICTCAYGMGIDKTNVRTVIHFEAFDDVESYLQESGRAGRDRRPAKAIQLCEIRDISIEALIQTYSHVSYLSDVIRGIKSIYRQHTLPKTAPTMFEQYLLAIQCRRVFLMETLQSMCNFCEGCDSCENNVCTYSFEFYMLLRFIKQYAGMYTIRYFTQNNLHHKYAKLTNPPFSLHALLMHVFSKWTTPQIHAIFEHLCSLNIIKVGKLLWKQRLFLSKKGTLLLKLLTYHLQQQRNKKPLT